MITVAKTAGFCFGVKRAVDDVYRRMNGGEHLATLGELIHNPQVVEDLASHGIYSYASPEDIPTGICAVIRTHGVGEETEKRLREHSGGYIDLTCPFVEKIHKIAKREHDKNREVVIVGDKNHPEVVGINGWCENSAHIIYDPNDSAIDELKDRSVSVVAQTTIKREVFDAVVSKIEEAAADTEIFDTICAATRDRQREAEELAKKSDAMIVIGGRTSSNTAKLYEISKKFCADTIHIETFEEIPQKIYNKKIGITAGASTPSRIIEEVIKAMEENIKKEENFAELFAQSESKALNNGDIVDGTVLEVRNTEVIVELPGSKYNGQLAADQLTDDPALKPQDVVKPGDVIKVYVVGVNDGEGKVVLSKKKVDAQISWNKLKAAFEAGDVLTGKIVRAVKGGVIALYEGNQVFIPAKQAGERFIQDLNTLVGQTVNFKIIEFTEGRRPRVIGSVRVILEEQRRQREEKFWADAEVGKKYTGVVKSLTNFGAFVDIGGVDGLVHISELSWTKIKKPQDVCSVGDTMEVYIKDLNMETKKISLGFKKAEDNPWVIAQKKFHVGDVVKAKIVRMMPFGAFAELLPSVDGLIHISQIADRRIGKPEDVLTIGQEVDVKITDVNWEDNKISLSIRALLEQPAPAPVEEEEEDTAEETLVYSTDPDVKVDAPIDVE